MKNYLILFLFFAQKIYAQECYTASVSQIGYTKVWKMKGTEDIIFRAGMAIDADGSPRAYHPKNIGLDDLKYAGKAGSWTAIRTDNGEPSGKPILQVSGDPAPGYYVSMTALVDPTYPLISPLAYVNSEEIPYIVLPSSVLRASSIKLGDLAVVYNSVNYRWTYAILADIGPENKIGEGSIRLARDLEINANPRNGGTEIPELVYWVFAGSGNGGPQPLMDIRKKTQELFIKNGGLAKMINCAPAIDINKELPKPIVVEKPTIKEPEKNNPEKPILISPSKPTGEGVKPSVADVPKEEKEGTAKTPPISPNKEKEKENSPQWVVSVSSSILIDDSKKVVEKIKKNGIGEVFIVKGDVNGKIMYRVLVGAYLEQDKAKAALDILKKDWATAWIINIDNWCKELEQKEEGIYNCIGQ
jgi:cell division septation protein DedD